VRPERLKAEQIIARLDREFAYRFHVEAVLWEREPLVSGGNPIGTRAATGLVGLRQPASEGFWVTGGLDGR
jgi:hypothetical protein